MTENELIEDKTTFNLGYYILKVDNGEAEIIQYTTEMSKTRPNEICNGVISTEQPLPSPDEANVKNNHPSHSRMNLV